MSMKVGLFSREDIRDIVFGLWIAGGKEGQERDGYARALLAVVVAVGAWEPSTLPDSPVAALVAALDR